MFLSTRLTKWIAAGAAALAVAGGAFGIVSATSSSGSSAATAATTSPVASSASGGHSGFGGGGSNARSGPAAGGSSGKVTSLSERGIGDDSGRHRLTFFSQTRRFRVVVDRHGAILQRSTINFGDSPLPASVRKPGG